MAQLEEHQLYLATLDLKNYRRVLLGRSLSRTRIFCPVTNSISLRRLFIPAPVYELTINKRSVIAFLKLFFSSCHVEERNKGICEYIVQRSTQS
jgi:hypothetical protein